MATNNEKQHPFTLPKLKYNFNTGTQKSRFIIYDVKFYPYAKTPNLEPVFAALSENKVYIGRLSAHDDVVITMLHELEDEQGSKDQTSLGLNSCSWCYISQQQPLLAIAGMSGQLKIINTVSGTHFTTLVGHGQGTINDIATHPIYPWIVATASMDRSIRIWDIRRHDKRHESPTIIICGQSTGHTEGTLTISWHSSGRYLISGGHDHRVCVWTIPDLSDESSFWQELAPENRKRSSHEVRIIYFPHFTTSAVHHAFVDCVRFFGDLIVSRAAKEGKIVLWQITGLNTRKPPPSSVTAPKTEEYLDTRNGFMRKQTQHPNGIETVTIAPEFEDQPPYRRLLEFDSPNSDTFYLRFALLLPSPSYPDVHPTIAFGNTATEVRFWDLERLSLGHAGGLDENRAPTGRKKRGGGASARGGRGAHLTTQLSMTSDRTSSLPSSTLHRDSTVSSTSNIGSETWSSRQALTEATPPSAHLSDDLSGPLAEGMVAPSTFLPPNRKKYPLHDPHSPIKCHEKVTLTELQYKRQSFFTARAADWSPCGRWCVVVGESSVGAEGWGGFAVLYR